MFQKNSMWLAHDFHIYIYMKIVFQFLFIHLFLEHLLIS